MRKKSWETLDKCSHPNASTTASFQPLFEGKGSASVTNYNFGGMAHSSLVSEFSSDFSDTGGGGDGKTMLRLGGWRIKMSSTSVNCPHQKWGGRTLLNSRVNVLVQILAILALFAFSCYIPTVQGIKPSKYFT